MMTINFGGQNESNGLDSTGILNEIDTPFKIIFTSCLLNDFFLFSGKRLMLISYTK